MNESELNDMNKKQGLLNKNKLKVNCAYILINSRDNSGSYKKSVDFQRSILHTEKE